MKKVLKKDKFFKKMAENFRGLSYDDVLLLPCHSEVMPGQVDLRTQASRNIWLNNPVISSPMDTVTEDDMAIEMAKLGGIGIIHRACTPREQAKMVDRTKYYFNERLDKPICVRPADTVGSVLKMIAENNYKFRSFPVIDNSGRLAGILTGNDFDFCLDPKTPVEKVMTTKVITAKESTTLKQAFRIMVEKRKKILPLVGEDGKLTGLYVYSDALRRITGNTDHHNLDANGRLRVGAAVGVLDDALERAELLVRKHVDVIVVDSAHGDTENVIVTIRELKKRYPGVDVIGGNVSRAESAKRLVRAGADGIKVGQGPGSICTTRVVSGAGRAQMTAIHDCARALRGSGVPVIADGGLKYSGDVTKALGAGADAVMFGSLLAGTKEAPGEVIMINDLPHKSYRGMGSLGAMQASEASKERYRQGGVSRDKLVPEGVEGAVPFKGEVSKIVHQLLGGLSSGMGYLGVADIKHLQEKAEFEYITPGAQRESHPHSITIVKDAPNYSRANG